MSRAVKLYDLAPSPNNIKVRLALAYKRIPYERIPVDLEEREPLIQVSGQPLAPVLVHGESVLFDSAAILRYLDANWPSPPRLFSSDRQEMRQIDEWELFGRTEIGGAVGTLFAQSFETSPDLERVKKACKKFNHAASRVEEALSQSTYLMGEAPNAADFSLVPMMNLSVLSPQGAKSNPIYAFFAANLKLENAPKTRDWIGRVMAFDQQA
ncbi:MAG: glutathione S-transferase family protein [Acidobacteria bacterium]|nr:glutathione S-transferase family protein [Acidobacteriota bacterium]